MKRQNEHYFVKHECGEWFLCNAKHTVILSYGRGIEGEAKARHIEEVLNTKISEIFTHQKKGGKHA